MADQQQIVLPENDFVEALNRSGEKVSIPRAWLTDDRLSGSFLPAASEAPAPAKTARTTTAKKADADDVI